MVETCPSITCQMPFSTHENETKSLQATPEAQVLIQSSISTNTRRTYQSALNALETWLEQRTLTDALLAEYLAESFQKGLAPASLSIIPAAVQFACRLAGTEPPIGPLTRQTLANSRREGHDRGPGQVTGISFNEVDFIAKKISRKGLHGCRDAALLTLMSDAMLRVSELVAVQMGHLAFLEDRTGRLMIPASKTDQEGEDCTMFLGRPTVKFLQAWLHAIQGQLGPLNGDAAVFRYIRKGGKIQGQPLRVQSIRKIIQKRARDSEMEGRFSGQSLRVGSAQSLAMRGATLQQLQQVGRWQTSRMPAQYCRNELASRSAMSELRYK